MTENLVSELDRVVSRATSAHSVWGGSVAVERSRGLHAAAQALRVESTRLAELIAAETKKTVKEAQGELANACNLLDFFAGTALRPIGDTFPSNRAGVTVYTRRFPLGVVGVITPWNFPANMAILKVAPAIAAGNAVVIKPSEFVQQSTAAIADVLAPHFPHGLIASVGGSVEVGKALVAHPEISAVAFTGSTAVGREIAAAAASRGIPALCEMGGKNCITVTESAEFAKSVDAVLTSAFSMNGQKCTAAANVFVSTQVYDAFKETLLARLPNWADEQREMLGEDFIETGLVDQAAWDRVKTVVAQSKGSNALVTYPSDGVIDRNTPVVLEDVTPQMPVYREEVFGPVISLIRYESLSDVIAEINSLEYGLVASIYTKDLPEALSFSESVEAGTVLVNQPTTGLDFNIPFVGWKASGFGPSEQADDAVKAYTREKTIYLS
ncbi:aldehyde dehydrogenase family protein [Rhodococcus sp. ABRD24]|uniref:aldehyde dehydrogenase family protein n=1 Tax=Rhodococcus sp. ABRD24 TaxID=2507582 RepID=UPI0013F1698D|nr:aldehyde dehydrogenase family protein [Rhodococcus sp. ABRD24]